MRERLGKGQRRRMRVEVGAQRGGRSEVTLTMVGLRTRRVVTGCPLRRQLSPTDVPGDTSGSYLYGGNL